MKLVNRVSVYFLTALAIVLVVYSALFYAFVRARFVWQFDQELHGAFNSLVAAVEVEPEDVSWQPLEHTIALGAAQGPNEVQWAVIGDGGRVVDTSRNASLEITSQAKEIFSRAPISDQEGEIVTNDDWHILFQRLVANAPDRGLRDLDEFDEIVVVVALSAAPLSANLRRLFLLACVLPVGTWLAAAAAGHWLCRRAVRPVLEMSERSRSITTANFDFRLPAIDTGDELAGLAEAFNTLLDHQHRAFEQQRRFTGDAAHELRTPLTVLLGQIDVALRRARSPEEYAATLGVLRGQAAQLSTIVESLLFLARAEVDAAMPDAESLSLAQWLPDYMNRWQEHPRRDDIRLHICLPEARGVSASPALLARLLDNLIENAVKYSPPGSKVAVSALADDTNVLLEVQDHGCGIAADDQSHIFKPFFRSRAARDAGIAGTGLGLAIAGRIAIALGGRLWCSSEIGRGSRFTLELPAISCNQSSTP